MVNMLWENFFKKDRTVQTITSMLRENYIFQDLSKRDLRFVQEIIHNRNYRAGERIFSQGEIGVGMYIIIKGSVEIRIRELTTTSEAKGEILITRLTAGDFFGELALVEENGRRSATAVAYEETQLLGFFKSDLVEILERNPTAGFQVVFRLAEVLGRRLKETTDKISELRRYIKDIKTEATTRNSPGKKT